MSISSPTRVRCARAETRRRRPFTLAAVALSGVACTPTDFGDRHAARVERFQPSPFVSLDADFSRADNALGPPDGRTVAIGEGGYIVLRFFRAVVDEVGPDLRVYEIGPDGARARVAVSETGESWTESTSDVSGPSTDLDLSELGRSPINFVRVRGLDRAGPDPGFDLDAVEALH